MVGPRQVGKTTLLLALAKTWGTQGLYVAADAPTSQLPGWREQIWRKACDLARQQPAALFIDEIQGFWEWSAWLKSAHDAVVREGLPLHVVATGSSALSFSSGSRESMAGLFEKIVVRQWSAVDVSTHFGVPVDEAPYQIVRRGGYPGAVRYWREEPWEVDAVLDGARGKWLVEVKTGPYGTRDLRGFAHAPPGPAGTSTDGAVRSG